MDGLNAEDKFTSYHCHCHFWDPNRSYSPVTTSIWN